MPLSALILAILGSAALLAFTLGVPAIASPSAGAEEEAVARQFYAAINDAVRTGDLSLLDRVAAGIDRDDVQGAAETGCDLRCRVSALHRLAPDVRLGVDEVLVDGDRVAARISLQGNDRPVFLGLPLQDDLAPWGPVDFLRVDDGQVVEVQLADGPPTLVETLGRTVVEGVPVAPYRLGLVRLTLEPSAAIPELFARGPVFLLVESGTLVVRVDQPTLVQRPGHAAGPVREELLAAGAIVLSPGERIALVADTGYALHSIGNEAAVVLSAAALVGDGSITNRWVRARPLDEILFTATAPEYVAQTSAPTPWPPGVRSELIAEGIITTRPAPSATLELARLTLPSHAALPIHDTPGAELLVVETGSGIVDLVAGDGAIRPQTDASLARISRHGGSSAHGPRVSPGGSAVLQPGSSAGVRNAGEEPLVLLILTVEPGPDVQ